ncbi:autotransporter beta-domain protein, partial [Chlamydia psittaci 06-1683]
IFPSIRI